MINYEDDWFVTDIELSKNKRARYSLVLVEEKKSKYNKTLSVILQNPSRANKTRSDKSVNNVIKCAAKNDYDRVEIYNLLPIYATHLSMVINSHSISSNDLHVMNRKNDELIRKALIRNDGDILISTGDLVSMNSLREINVNETTLQLGILFLKNYLEILKLIRCIRPNSQIFVLGWTKTHFGKHISRVSNKSLGTLIPVKISNDLSLK